MSLNPGLATAGGIGQGLMSFADSYMKSKQMAQQNDLNQQYVQIAKQNAQKGLLADNMETTPTGDVQYNQQGLLDQQAKTQQLNDTIANNNPDPKHPDSVKKRSIVKNVFNAIRPGSGDSLVKDNMSAADLSQYDPYIKEGISALGNAQKMQALAGPREDQVQIAKDNQTSHVGDIFDKDPIMNKINKQRQQIDIDKHTLQSSNGDIPVQMINEVQQGLANAISGGGSAGLGKTEQVEIQNRNTRLQSILQKVEPGVNKVHDPELVQYLSDTLDRLGNAYDNNGYSRAQQIAKGRNYKFNQSANQAMQDKVESYKPQSQGLLGGQGQQQGPPGGHQTVQQNGHTYTWNNSTGKYE